MTFQSQHGLTVDAIAGPAVWTALLAAAGAGTTNTAPYDYVLVSKQLPENLTLYENGVPTMTGIAVNTGYHFQNFQNRLIRNPIRKTTKSPSISAVCRAWMMVAMIYPDRGRFGAALRCAPSIEAAGTRQP